MKTIALLFFIAHAAFASDVLVIGDSHTVGPYGQTMDSLLRLAGHRVQTNGVCGSIAQWWFNGHVATCGYWSKDKDGFVTEKKTNEPIATPHLSTLLHDFYPEFVVMEFSGNYRDYPEAFIIQDIQNMISEIKNFGAKCLFVTAPDARVRKPALMAAIAAAKKAVGTECEFFDSTLVTNYPLFGGDGVHYNFPLGEPIAKKWAQRVYERFVELNY